MKKEIRDELLRMEKKLCNTTLTPLSGIMVMLKAIELNQLWISSKEIEKLLRLDKKGYHYFERG